ncbi:unnamed protein product [Cochlearia groenlandica]
MAAPYILCGYNRGSVVANLSASLEPGFIFGIGIEGASHLSARRLYVPDQAAEAFRGGNKIKVAKRGSAQASAESPKSRGPELASLAVNNAIPVKQVG